MDPNTLFCCIVPALFAFAGGYHIYRTQGGKSLLVRRVVAQAENPGGLTYHKKEIPKIENPTQAAEHWLSYVNDNPDGVPHLAVVGPSGSGKTTLVTAVLDSRDGQIVVLTAKEGDHWGGIDYIGIDEDATYTTANRTFSTLLSVVKQRLLSVKRARKTNTPAQHETLTVVVDDFSTLQKECKDAAEFVKLVARLGRSLRIRLVMLSDSAFVKAIGLEGEGETRSNFAFLRLQRGHGATIEIDNEQLPINTTGINKIADRANLASRQWFIPMLDVDEEAIPVLGGVLLGGIKTPDTTPDKRYSTDIDAVLIGMLIDRGLSANKIYDIIGGNRNDVLNAIRRIRSEP